MVLLDHINKENELLILQIQIMMASNIYQQEYLKERKKHFFLNKKNTKP
jgi:hypothetical protein